MEELKGLPLDRIEDAFVVVMASAIEEMEAKRDKLEKENATLILEAYDALPDLKSKAISALPAGVAVGKNTKIVVYTKVENKKGKLIKHTFYIPEYYAENIRRSKNESYTFTSTLRSTTGGIHIDVDAFDTGIAECIKKLVVNHVERLSLTQKLDKVYKFKGDDKHKYIAAKIRTESTGLITDEIIQRIKESILL